MKLRFWFISLSIIFTLSSCEFIDFLIEPTGFPGQVTLQDETTQDKTTPINRDMAGTKTPFITITQDPTESTVTPFSTFESGKKQQDQISTPDNIPTKTQAPLSVQIGSPIAVKNFVYPDLGCNWWGVAGQVLDKKGQPIVDAVVEVGGTLDGQPFFGIAITGESTAYGPGGYEVKLGENPLQTDGIFWALVYDLDGKVISSPTYFSTFADCNRNLVLLNFVQSNTLPKIWAYLPLILSTSSSLGE
jgi:hypothetical protein